MPSNHNYMDTYWDSFPTGEAVAIWQMLEAHGHGRGRMKLGSYKLAFSRKAGYRKVQIDMFGQIAGKWVLVASLFKTREEARRKFYDVYELGVEHPKQLSEKQAAAEFKDVYNKLMEALKEAQNGKQA